MNIHNVTGRLFELLRHNHLKATNPRMRILETFSKRCKPINAEEVFKKVAKDGIDLVTVYRTLKVFEEKGIVKPIDLRRQSVYYELNVSGHHHHHISCVSCGVVEEVPVCNIQLLSKKILAQTKIFKNIQDHSLEFFGICKTCAR